MNRSLIFYFTSEVFLSFGLGIIQYAQPFFYASSGISDKVIGILFSLMSVSGGVGALFLGSLSDKVGVTRMFKWATLLIGVGYLLTSLTIHVELWMFTACLSGLSGALLMTTENVVLSSLTKTTEKAGLFSKFVAWYMFLMGSGAAASGFLCTQFGYQTTMKIGAIIILIAPAIRLFVKGRDFKAKRVFRVPHKGILLMTIYALLFGLASNMLNPFATLILQNNFHMSAHATAIVSALSTLCISVSSLFVGSLLRALRRGPTLFLSFLFTGGLTFGLAALGSAGSFAILYLGRATVSAIPGSIVDAAFLERTEKTEFAQMFGFRVFGNNMGWGLGSFIGGTLLANEELPLLLIGSGFIFFIAYVYLVGLFRKLKQVDALNTSRSEQALSL